MENKIQKAFALALLFLAVESSAQDYIGMQSNATPQDVLRGRESGFWTVDGYDYIRGVNSLYSSSRPLYIIDGVYVNQSVGDLSFLSVLDIDSITVLKDASQTAAYGAEGANGVVIIKTKSSGTSPVEVNWSSNAGPGGHNHHLSARGGNNATTYNLSAFYKDYNDTETAARSKWEGVKMDIGTKANKYIWFNAGAIASKGLSDFGEDDDNTRYHATASSSLRINLLECLYLNAQAGVDFSSMNRIMWYGNDTDYGAANNGVAKIVNSSMLNHNVEGSLVFHRYLSSVHLLNLKTGYRGVGNISKNGINVGSDFSTHELKGRGLSLMQSERTICKYNYDFNRKSFFAGAAYSYDSIFDVNAYAELERAKKYDDSFNLFYSVNGLLDVRRLFLRSVEAISALKFSGGFGMSGKENSYPYEFTGSHLPGFVPEIDSGGAPYFDSFNRAVSSELNMALEFGLFKNALKGKLAYYGKHTRESFTVYSFGEINEKGLWDWTDRKEYLERECSFVNRGFELDLDVRAVEKQDVSLLFSFKGSYGINQFIKVSSEDLRGLATEDGIIANANVIGKPIGAFWGYQDFKDGAHKDINRDGRLSEADKEILGSWIPVFTGGLETEFSFKRFHFQAILFAMAGNKKCDFKALAEDGSESLSSKYISDGSDIRLTSLGVSYDIPLKVRPIKDIRVKISGNNLREPCFRTVMAGLSVSF